MAEEDHGHEAVYDASAAAWDEARRSNFPERPLIDQIATTVPRGAAVLDLGCGAGAPVALHLAGMGLEVTGLDFSAQMLALARARLPDVTFVQGDMRQIDLGRRFDAIIAWDSFFHLTRHEQRALIPRLADHLAPGGWLLFTCGPDEGESWGQVSGGPVFHASLSPADYADCLEAAGFLPVQFLAEAPGFAGRSFWLARLR